MKGIMRPTRGRPNKVIKTPGTPRGVRTGRPTSANAGVQQQQPSSPDPDPDPDKHQQQQQQQQQQQEYDDAMISELNVAAAAAAAAAAISAAEGGGELNDAEADAEMEDDDQDHSGMHGQHHEQQHEQHHEHTESMDLTTAANILANGGTVGQGGQLAQATSAEQHHHQQMQQHHQASGPMGGMSPHALDGHTHSLDPSFVKTTAELALDSGYDELNVESALAKRLSREPGLRLAQQRRPDQKLNLHRRSNVEALFAHIAGDLAPSACKNCHKGHGPWTTCVVVDGQMCGSCANCWFNASGARCSFHETRNPQAAHHPSLMSNTSQTGAPPDPNASYVLPQQHNPPPQMQHQQPPQQPGPPGHNPTLAALPGSGSNDPVVRYTVERAMAEVRTSDRRTRQIMMIEIAAKQLALQIVEYEDSVRDSQNVNGQGDHAAP